jgi:hypothetical protein
MTYPWAGMIPMVSGRRNFVLKTKLQAEAIVMHFWKGSMPPQTYTTTTRMPWNWWTEKPSSCGMRPTTDNDSIFKDNYWVTFAPTWTYWSSALLWWNVFLLGGILELEWYRWYRVVEISF